MASTNIVMILDASGSMQQIQGDIIGSVNKFVEDEKVAKSQSLFTLVTFSDKVETKIFKKPISEIPLLTKQNYVINGLTALFQAIVDTIEMFKDETDVVMCIVTDGQENRSPANYTRKSVFDTVTKFKDEKGWTFSYLSCNLDTFEQGANLGFGTTHQNDPNYAATGSANTCVGYVDMGKALDFSCKKAVEANEIKKTMSVQTTNSKQSTDSKDPFANIVI
jgi:hypothetical protein